MSAGSPRPAASHPCENQPLSARSKPPEANPLAESGGTMAAAPKGRTALYRLYDAEDNLLYIGIAATPEQRWSTHASNKRWWPSVAGKVVEWHPTRAGAAAAEIAAVQDENPRYNVDYSAT